MVPNSLGGTQTSHMTQASHLTSVVKPNKANFNSTFAHEPGAGRPGKSGEDESQLDKTADSVIDQKKDTSLRA